VPGFENVIDPDHFREGDTPADTQAKRIAMTLDIQMRYAPLFEEVSKRPLTDPTRERDRDRLIKRQKAEMDKRFTQATKKPVIKPIEVSNEGHLKKYRALTPDTFVFNIGVKGTKCLRCGKQFIKSRKHRKYCSHGCEERAKRDRYIQKRRERFKKLRSNEKTDRSR
jgi:hypothetical protein